MAGGLLAASEIKRYLARDELVDNGSGQSVRGASYDVHVARDEMTIPENGTPKNYPRGTNGPEYIILHSGEVASVTSSESFCLPWHIAGNIGVRFGFA